MVHPTPSPAGSRTERPRLLLQGFPQWLLDAEVHRDQVAAVDEDQDDNANSNKPAKRQSFPRVLQLRLQEELEPYLNGGQIDVDASADTKCSVHCTSLDDTDVVKLGIGMDNLPNRWPTLKHILIQFDDFALTALSKSGPVETGVSKKSLVDVQSDGPTNQATTTVDTSNPKAALHCWKEQGALWTTRLLQKLAEYRTRLSGMSKTLTIPTSKSFLDCTADYSSDPDEEMDPEDPAQKCVLVCVPGAFCELLADTVSLRLVKKFGDRYDDPQKELLFENPAPGSPRDDVFSRTAMPPDIPDHVVHEEKRAVHRGPEHDMFVFDNNSVSVFNSSSQDTPLFFTWALRIFKAIDKGENELKQKLEELKDLQKRHDVPVLKIALAYPIHWIFKKAKKLFSSPVLGYAIIRSRGGKLPLLNLLLKYGACADAKYEMFPCGLKQARGQFLVLGLSREPCHAKLLIDNGAQVNRQLLMNYFPTGNTLWSVVWRNVTPMINALLDMKANTNSRGWDPDSPPLAPGSKIHEVLRVAAMSCKPPVVQRLLDEGAKLNTGIADVFARAPLPNVKVLAVPSAKDHPELMLKADTLTRADGHRISLIFEEIAKDGVACSKLHENVLAACREPDKRQKLLDGMTALIRRSPKATVNVFDNIFLQRPEVDDPHRNAMPAECTFAKGEDMNTAYVKECKWKYYPPDAIPDAARAWQEQLAPVSHPEHATHTSPAGPTGSDPTQGFRKRARNAWRSFLRGSDTMEFCDIAVVCFPGVMDYCILDAMHDLSQDRRVELLNESKVFRALVHHFWDICASWYDISDLMATVMQFVVLVIWWRCKSDPGALKVCWGLFTGGVLVDWCSLFMSLLTCTVGGLLILQCALGLLLAMGSWESWLNPDLYEEYRGSLANMVALCLLMVFYEMRVFNPWNPMGIQLGHNLVPILNTLRMAEIHTMMILLFTVVCATFLASVIAFGDMEGEVAALVRTWQTLIVGESSLFDADAYEDPFSRYVVVSMMFFLSNVVLMNIFVNVTGEGYTEQMQMVKGSFSADRFDVCYNVLLESNLTRASVLLLVTVAWIVSLVAVSTLDVAASDSIMPVILAYVFWLVCFLHQWSIVVRYAPRCSPAHRPSAEACHIGPGNVWRHSSWDGNTTATSDTHKHKPCCNDPKCASCCHLWVCIPLEQGKEDEQSAGGSSRTQDLSELVCKQDLQEELKKLQESLNDNAPRKGSKQGPQTSQSQGERHRTFDWLGILLDQASVYRHLDAAVAWAEKKDMLPSDLLGGDALAASPWEAYAYLEDLISTLDLSNAAAQRLRKVVHQARRQVIQSSNVCRYELPPELPRPPPFPPPLAIEAPKEKPVVVE